MRRAVYHGLVSARSSRRAGAPGSASRAWQSTSSSSSAVTPTSSHVPATIPIDFNVASKVSGQESQTLEVALSPGQVLRAESGAMLYMTQGIKMETTLGADGVSAGFRRMLTGQNVFISDYTYEGPEGTTGTVGLGTDFPSKILRLNLEEYGGKIVCQKGAYMAGSDTVDIEIAFTKSLTSGFFGGEGFVLQSLSGSGDVFVKAGGTLVRRDLKEGETLRVSSGCLVAMTQTIDFDATMMPGIKNAMFGGEGLFVTTLTGPGTVWLQGMPPDRLISAIAQRVPSGGIGLGVPLGIGGVGGGGEGADGAAVAGADEVAPGADVDADAGGEDMVAATDAAIDADRQATVASSGLYDDQSSSIDSDSPSALFGDAAPQDETSAPESSSSGFDEEPPSSTFSLDDSSTDFGEDTTNQQFNDFADETQFSTGSEPANDDFGMDDSTEEFDTGDFGGDDGGGGGSGGDDEGGIGDLLRNIWDFFNDED